MDLYFDIRGNLSPEPTIIQSISMTDFESQFVAGFEENTARLRLFEVLQNYITDWQTYITTDVEQWVDGSFITTKHTPNDIDILTFIDYRDYDRCKAIIETKFITTATKVVGIDAYIVKTYPNDHPFYTIYKADYLYWLNHFGHTRLNRHKKQFKKGIIQLNHTT